MSLSWSKLDDIHPWIQDAITSLGYPSMTPVQASTIPLFSKNKDVVVESVTGSGKTLAFVIPVLHHISKRLYDIEEDEDSPKEVKKGHFLATVISPTRELAHQIQQVFDKVLESLPQDKHPIKTQLVVGSLHSTREDVEELLKNRNQIIIGTPGRLLEFFSNKKVFTNSLEVAVLDEADKLLDLSFETEVLSLLKLLPKQRRTGLFSATLSAAGDKIFRTGMSNPVKVSVKSKQAVNSAPSSLSIHYMMVEAEKKLTTFLTLLLNYRFKKCIAYFPTCSSVKFFHKVFDHSRLAPEDVKFYSLFGQLSASARLKTLKGFTEGDTNTEKSVLLTTDVAARGIDIADVDLVIQVDPPNDTDMFLHRCGRTGRANKQGNAIVMLNEGTREIDFVDFMEVKGVLMTEMLASLDDDFHKRFQEKLKKYMLDDRARHEQAIRSFVSFVRYYSKHTACSIFRLQALDYIGIARMYGLLRLPKMPETRYIASDIMPEDGWLIEEPIDMDRYAYKDESREKNRLETLEEEKVKKAMDAKKRKMLKKKNESWSSKMDTKEGKQIRREQMKRKREEIKQELLENSTDEEETQVDWKDMVRQNKKKRGGVVQGSFEGL